MSLAPETLSPASRLMLPTYVALFAVVGGAYAFTPHERLLAGPGVRYADHLVGIRVWACIFLAVSALQVLAYARDSRTLMRYALCVGVVVLSIWCGVLAAAVVFGSANLAGVAFVFVTTRACYATARSLTKGSMK